MVAALYRRYRPDTFADLIGQSHVTDPLRAALRADRVNHAYLFSGPRGCGKTTSARILARCLNCAEGPTDTPCGVCDSCVDLATGGNGSLDVVEIDAASHNGVDDARDLRERAFFAPSRDRFKIFILDEAHMVSSQGFNALLKIVEEPPEHVKFIFATTEPEKVLQTIRSRTHHYPFRLVPPATMLAYVQQLVESEQVTVEPGVLPLVIRAGEGSVRDTLSLLDQLIAGSEDSKVTYERAVALLGYTHISLLDAMVDALAVNDARGVFSALDDVVQSGQDPRRFTEDLLERLRDLIIVAASSDPGSILHGVPSEQLEVMQRQSEKFGPVELSRCADVVSHALNEMTGATSPKLLLELMAARLLVPASDDNARGTLVRVERLERRIGISGDSSAQSNPAPASAAVSSATPPATPQPSATNAPAAQASGSPASKAPSQASSASNSAPAVTSRPAAEQTAVEPARSLAPAVADTATEREVPEAAGPAESQPVGSTSAPAEQPGAAVAAAPVSEQQFRDSWPEVLAQLQARSNNTWMIVSQIEVLGFRDSILTLGFRSAKDVQLFKDRKPNETSKSDHLRSAIRAVLGIEVKFVARELPNARVQHGTRESAPPPAEPASSGSPRNTANTQESTTSSATARNASVAGGHPAATPNSGTTSSSGGMSWEVAPIPNDDDAPPLDEPEFDVPEFDVPEHSSPEHNAPRDQAPRADLAHDQEVPSNVSQFRSKHAAEPEAPSTAPAPNLRSRTMHPATGSMPIIRQQAAPVDDAVVAPAKGSAPLAATAPQESAQPGSFSPEPVAPEPVAPEPVAPEPVSPEPVAPEPVSPERETPGSPQPESTPEHSGETSDAPSDTQRSAIAAWSSLPAEAWASAPAPVEDEAETARAAAAEAEANPPEPVVSAPTATQVHAALGGNDRGRYGEAVIRELLGAEFIEEIEAERPVSLMQDIPDGER
ncbi:DNA polymerase III subunit gamma and tau [Humidisolicoccus flavus]|uniref:DNA polymerase III subunit gamma and tau n=1 Tax=Humidisolicoccus flavus TaxID=3111414 RepID=UPI0032433F0E